MEHPTLPRRDGRKRYGTASRGLDEHGLPLTRKGRKARGKRKQSKKDRSKS